jgi:uncharacterized protein YkwD
VLVVRQRGVALLLLAFALLAAPALAQAANCTPDPGWGSVDRASAQQVAVQLNQARAANGLGALALSPTLTASAEWKSLHMGFYNYFDHPDPAPPIARSPGQRMLDCGYPSNGTGENIAAGFNTVSSVMDAWMNSPGHRANILGSGYAVMGIGVGITAGGTYYWTVDFGAVADPGTVPVGTTPTPPVPAPAPPPAPIVPPPSVPAPPPTPIVPVTTPATTAPKATIPTPAPVKSSAPAAPAAPAAQAATGTAAGKDIASAIGKPVASTSRLVAMPDKFHAHAGTPRILHPLGNDQNPSAEPLRILAILEKPKNSKVRVVRQGHAIKLRLPRGAHGAQHIVYIVSTAAGELARGVITIMPRRLG